VQYDEADDVAPHDLPFVTRLQLRLSLGLGRPAHYLCGRRVGCISRQLSVAVLDLHARPYLSERRRRGHRVRIGGSTVIY